MRRVIVEDQFDCGVCGILLVELIEEADEFTRPVTVLDAGVHLARNQIDPSEQAQRAMALVFMIPRERLMLPWPRGQVRCGIADCLDAGLLVVRDDRNIRLGCFAFSQDCNLTIDAEHFRHLRLELRVAPFEIVADLVRLHLVSGKDLADGTLHYPLQARMPAATAFCGCGGPATVSSKSHADIPGP